MERDCEECGDPIAPKRLELLPRTEFCVHCQEELERKGLFKKHKINVIAKTNGQGEVEELQSTMHRGTEV